MSTFLVKNELSYNTKKISILQLIFLIKQYFQIVIILLTYGIFLKTIVIHKQMNTIIIEEIIVFPKDTNVIYSETNFTMIICTRYIPIEFLPIEHIILVKKLLFLNLKLTIKILNIYITIAKEQYR